jgi:hypothetical protein
MIWPRNAAQISFNILRATPSRWLRLVRGARIAPSRLNALPVEAPDVGQDVTELPIGRRTDVPSFRLAALSHPVQSVT